ncbi:LytTR family DNA-binding domain-containing protein [Lactococcus cremoris]|uniref:LytR/AlgR family response regulator transcription factor n=1 Tax=Lactococcus lactis subsp. cremoris TaxID=1359 RepID=UPI0021AA113B|nr:LytTR family DNA-binding domain-containing protein [Lactococcus cremoris]MCT4433139.1 LytTR family transcriptional regulator [Lactococcus cremoris]
MKIIKKIVPNITQTEIIIKTRSEIEYNKIIQNFDQRIPLNTTDGLRLVEKKDIIYVESFKNYSKLHTKNDEYTLRLPLYKMNESLGFDFIQVSRFYLINFKHLTSVEADLVNGMIARVSDLKIPISRNYIKNLYEWMEIK